MLRCLYRFHYGQEIPGGDYHFQRFYKTRSPLGDRQAHRAVTRGPRLRQSRRVVVPLCADEVARFWRSFRTFRGLALVGLMLLDGLRSCRLDTVTKTQDVQLVQQSCTIGAEERRYAETIYPMVQEGMRDGIYPPRRGCPLCLRRYCGYWRECEREYGGRIPG